MSIDEQAKPVIQSKLWLQIRKFLVLQVKLYVDAFRDLCVSVLALGAFILDLLQQNDGPDSHFETVMGFGRKTEAMINLFNQYDPQQQGARNVDTVLQQMEERLRR